MKIKAQQIYEEIPAENIDELEQTLKDIGFDEQKIRDIIDPLKKQVETTTTPEEPPTPGVPEEPKTGPEQSKHVLQPGMTMKRLQSVDPDELFEDKVEEYLDSGEEFDVAVHKAHKHLERVVDYLELHGQRELKGPAKGKVFGDSVYDQILDIVNVLDVESYDKVYNAWREETTNIEGKIENIVDEIKEKIEDESIHILLDDINNLKDQLAAVPDGLPDWDSADMYLRGLADEVKQVGLSTQAGVTSPSDLGEWLY